MVKVQDFAREQGVTDRAIQKHIQKHAKELDGHVQRRGKNGTWLDETAIEFIKGLMIQQPLVVSDASISAENEKLRLELERLNRRNEDLATRLTDALDEIIRMKELQLEQTKATLALEAARAEKEAMSAEISRLQADLEAAQDQAAETEEKLDRLKRRTLWERITRAGEE